MIEGQGLAVTVRMMGLVVVMVEVMVGWKLRELG